MGSSAVTNGLGTFLLALVFVVLSILARGAAHARRGQQWARQLEDDLKAPIWLLSLYLAARLGLFGLDGHRHPNALHGLLFCAHFFGGVATLRLLDAALFGFIRSRGREGLPRILRSLALWLITFVIAAIATRREYQFELSSLFATSALLSVVLGFALQEPLGNLFAGLTLNAEHPFEPGDWVTFGKYTAKVVDVGWRSTRMETLDDDELLVPNSMIAREVVQNHSRPSQTDCVELLLRLDLDASPGHVRDVVLAVLGSCPLVLKEPAATVQLVTFSDNGVDYRVRFYGARYGLQRAVVDQVQSALWYALRRANIEIPYPQQTVSFRERTAEAEERRRRENLSEAEDLLGRIDFVAALKPEARRTLANYARLQEYGLGEAVVRQGEQGDTVFLVARGEVAVRVTTDGGEKEVARLQRGAFFGEMSVLTGEPRTATVVATGDAALLAVDRDAFSRVFKADPGVMQELAVVIAGRKAELASAKAQGSLTTLPETESLLSRIRNIFGGRR